MIKALITKYGGKNSTIPDLKFLLNLLRFAGFLRIEKLLEVKLKHKITREPLRNLNPKTDQHREGHFTYTFRIKSE